ncbi:MAG TPA: protealysin inhibitor emfourin [Blastocatellia bacterium]|nr:protealysin inhibitor emfourin [Blastocatellia bacterium]
MIVRHERSGGFAGLTVTAEVDSETLTTKEAKELKGLVEQAFPADQPKKKKATMPDQFEYEFVVEDNGKSRKYSVNDETITDEMRALSKWLIATAQKQKS